MDVGSDLIFVRALASRRLRRILGVAMVGVGVLLLAGAGSYYLYATYARSQLDELEVNRPLPTQASPTRSLVVAPEEPAPTAVPTTVPPTAVPTSVGTEAEGSAAPPTPEVEQQLTSIYIPSSRFTTVYPGQGIHPKYWDSPYFAEAYRPAGWDLIQGFTPVKPEDAAEVGSLTRARGIQIPAIEVDSQISELRILNLGNSLQWETPKNVVGHIPSTPNAGEAGRGYFFGHLESPIRGEGNVFTRLPDIPKLLQEGEEVYVILTADGGDQYLYQVFETKVVYQDDLRLEESSEPLVSLVACVPRLVYDHRLVVTGELVGVKKAS